jgi:hypothetical protein
MTSSAYVNAVLALDAMPTRPAPTPCTRSLEENARFAARRVGDDAAVAEPTGSIPVPDVELDQETGFRVRTLGIERHASH